MDGPAPVPDAPAVAAPPAPIPQDRSFLRSLVSSDDKSADSIVSGGLVCLAFLCCISAYVAFRDIATWNPVNFGGAAAVIIGAAAGGKTARDRWAGGNNPPTGGQ